MPTNKKEWDGVLHLNGKVVQYYPNFVRNLVIRFGEKDKKKEEEQTREIVAPCINNSTLVVVVVFL